MRALSAFDLEWLWSEVAHAVRRGQPLSETLQEMASASMDTSRGQAARMLVDSIRAGKPLSAAVASHPKTFPHYAGPAIEAGERSGRLSETLLSMAEAARLSGEFRNRLVGAMVYPFLVGLVVLAITFFIQFWLMPRFDVVYTQLEAWAFFSRSLWRGVLVFLQVECVLVFFGSMVLLGVLYGFPAGIEWRAPFLETLRVKVPVLGKAFRAVCVWRWANIMRLLTTAAVPEPLAAALAGRSAGNRCVEAASDRLSEAVAGGKRLSVALKESRFLEPIAAWMIHLSDERGDRTDVWYEVVGFYREIADGLINSAVVTAEVVLGLVMAQVVGMSVILLLVPMIRLMNALGG